MHQHTHEVLNTFMADTAPNNMLTAMDIYAFLLSSRYSHGVIFASPIRPKAELCILETFHSTTAIEGNIHLKKYDLEDITVLYCFCDCQAIYIYIKVHLYVLYCMSMYTKHRFNNGCLSNIHNCSRY